MTLNRDDRVKSVGPLLIKKCREFWEGMTAGERANYDIEDLFLELWVEIASKDELYRPERGQYTTYAMDLAHKYLTEIRNRARTVHSPRNSSGRLKVLSTDSVTAKAISASMKEPCHLEDTIEQDTDEEMGDAARKAMLSEMKRVWAVAAAMDDVGMTVLSMTYGVFGHQRLTATQIATRIGVGTREVSRIRRAAEARMAKLMADHRISGSKHEVDHEDSILEQLM